jgi:ribulose-phosphate 3-epimerase
MGPVVVRGIRPVTSLPFDVHLMISDPDKYLESFAQAGSNMLIPHIEATPEARQTIQAIHDLGCEAGIAIKPDTPLDTLRVVATQVELVLVMSVYPGFSGQSFIPSSVERVRQVRALLESIGSKAGIAIDGGVDTSNVGQLTAAGATNIISASAVYRVGIPIPEALNALRAAAQAGN